MIGANFLKSKIMSGLNGFFPGFEYLLAKIPDDTVIIKTPHGIRPEKLSANEAGKKQMKLLADLLGIDELDQIYIETKRNVIVVRGKTKGQNKETVI